MSETNMETPSNKKDLKIPEGITSVVILPLKNKTKQQMREHARKIKRLRIMGMLPFCHTHEVRQNNQ